MSLNQVSLSSRLVASLSCELLTRFGNCRLSGGVGRRKLSQNFTESIRDVASHGVEAVIMVIGS